MSFTKVCSKNGLAALTFLGLSVPTALGACAQSRVDSGNIGIGWKIAELADGSPASDATVSDLTFPMKVKPATLRAAGTYFAQQYYFKGLANGGYTGLQPRPDRKGHTRLHGVFSSFVAGTTSTDKGFCTDGADGGAGVSCAVDFNGDYGHMYEITVHKVADLTWEGVIVDTQTGRKIHAGTYRLPAGSGDLVLSGVGFVEYYGGTPQWTVPSCEQLPKIDVVFGPVTTSGHGGGIGAITDPHEYNSTVCLGAASGYVQTERTMYETVDGTPLQSTGWRLERGFLTD